MIENDKIRNSNKEKQDLANKKSSILQLVWEFDTQEEFIKSQMQDFSIGQKIKGLGTIDDMTHTQVKIGDMWIDKSIVIPKEKLSTSRISRILKTPPKMIIPVHIRYLRQIEKDVYKHPSLRSEALNKVIKNCTGKSLSDEPYFVSSVLFKIKRFHDDRSKELAEIFRTARSLGLPTDIVKQRLNALSIEQEDMSYQTEIER